MMINILKIDKNIIESSRKKFYKKKKKVIIVKKPPYEPSSDYLDWAGALMG